MKEEIEDKLSVLINLPLTSTGRVVDLQWFVFGVTNPDESNNEHDQFNFEYAIHVQCAWRISDTKGIVVASRDRYYSANCSSYEDNQDFNWDVPGSNQCDQKIANFIESKSTKPLIILSVEADVVGSLRINLSEGYVLDLFPDDSLGKEYWRFFKLNSDHTHFVVTGKGIE